MVSSAIDCTGYCSTGRIPFKWDDVRDLGALILPTEKGNSPSRFTTYGEHQPLTVRRCYESLRSAGDHDIAWHSGLKVNSH